ncbi:uncharacterized protein LOC109830781 [Asparagus officinalis]|uniref:uncharacterized protein LOC109830781 n=1 Tax=Asparagus officinalis TaxID=4686 RepID=UPI00098DF8F0|nr:uncharacterized protein LOC109830781 [Asparagus officinalis]
MEKVQDYNYPMWVQFPNLRLNLWSPTGISKIASLIGNPITTDKLTATRKRLSYARVLLEVKLPLKSPLPDQLVIQGPDGKSYTQKVIYEFKPKWCDTCKIIGHLTEHCRRKNGKMRWMPVHREKNIEKAPVPNTADGVAKTVPNIEIIEDEISGVNFDSHEQNITVDTGGFGMNHGNQAIAESSSGARAQKKSVGNSGSGIQISRIISSPTVQHFSSPAVNTTGFTSVTKEKSAKRNSGKVNNQGLSQLLRSSNQFMTCAVESKDYRLSCIFTVVYALNDNSGRKSLWHDILAFKQNVSCPWIIGGDFNTIIDNNEKIGGSLVTDTDTEDFQNFISSCQLMHLKTTGCFFTWCNKQDIDTRIWCRLDRVLVNEDWIQKYNSSQVEFLTPNCSDHSPGLITIEDDHIGGKRPFKFFKMWISHPDFLSTVSSG